ncbi:MAG TPA: LiaF domain-containing protein [Gemmatimonadaceae bacterium]|nr:LiaF domain-containing protein [Gemmatimonadaceae bacterium]
MISPNRAMQPPAQSSFQRILPPYLVEERSGLTAWWSTVKREGEWILPRNFRAFTFMGNVELDLTSAKLGIDTSEIEILCILGNVEITVPRDIRVVCDGEGLAGSFEIERIGDTTPPENAPTLRVSGNAYLGSVTVKIVGPKGPGLMEKLKATWEWWNA